MKNIEALLQNYKGGTCDFKQCGGNANPAVVAGALGIINGENTAYPKDIDVVTQNNIGAKQQSKDIGIN